MLATQFSADTPLPLVGSIGFRRGTGQKVLVLRRNRAQPGAERECLVKTFSKIAGHWYDDRGSSGNTVVVERDLFATEDEAIHAGCKSRRRSTRKAA